MPVPTEEPPPYTPTLPPRRFHLPAYTASATSLAEKLFHGRVSQDDFDAQTLCMSITSVTGAVSIPIIMTSDDTLTTILEHVAHDLNAGPANRERAEVCLWCPTKILESIGIPPPVSGQPVLLDQDGLKRLFTFLKESDQIEQLLLACDGDVADAELFRKLLSPEENRESDTHAARDRPSTASPVCRSSLEILLSQHESSAQNIVPGHHRNSALRNRREHNESANEQQDTEQEARASGKKVRKPGWRF